MSIPNSASNGYVPKLDQTCFGTPIAPVTAVLAPGRPVGACAGVGSWLGRYHLVEKLGEGGMGEVFRGEDSRSGETVAIKVISGFLVRRPEVLRRFEQEAVVLAKIDNPYVARLLEVDQDQNTHYLVMEFAGGGTLRQLLNERGPLPERTAVAVMCDVARALCEAHAQNIVHRDIKPENILLTERVPPQTPLDRATPNIKISDFGTARSMGESHESTMTMAGAIVGTPLYMSPEQCTGNCPLGPGIDIYAMGVTLFELLTGETPFHATDLVQLATMHCYDPPPSLKAVDPSFSDGVVRIVEKAMAKSPEARYATAAAMLADLTALHD